MASARPNEGWPWLALAAAAVGGLPMPGIIRVILWAGVAAFTARQVIPANLFNDEEWQGLRIHCYAAVAGGVLLLALTPLPARRWTVFVWALAVTSGAVLLHLAGNALFAELAVVLAIMLAAVGFSIGKGPAVAGAIAVAAVLHPALLAAGCFNNFSDVPTWAFAVVAMSPLAAIVTPRPESARGALSGALPSAKPPGRG